MEPVTQALLGAATAEVVAGRALGRRALLWGAAVGMSPDLDVVLGPLHGGYGEWLYHRGTTHALWFGFVAGPALGWLLWRWRDPERETALAGWIRLCIVALVTHPILDGFTPYGTQFFAPFWRERFAWNGIGIIDPFYTLPLAAGVVAVAWQRGRNGQGRRLLAASLVVTTLYLLGGVVLNHRAETRIRAALEASGAEILSVRAYPTVLQPWLRHFVARGPGRLYLGWHSLFAADCPSWNERAIPPRSQRMTALLETWEGGLLAWFAQGQVGFDELREPDGSSTVLLDDLRYAWGSTRGRGMWGVRARFGADGRILGAVDRFSGRARGGREVDVLISAIQGDLPGRALGWQLPRRCDTALTRAEPPGPPGTLPTDARGPSPRALIPEEREEHEVRSRPPT